MSALTESPGEKLFRGSSRIEFRALESSRCDEILWRTIRKASQQIVATSPPCGLEKSFVDGVALSGAGTPCA